MPMPSQAWRMESKSSESSIFSEFLHDPQAV